MQACAGDQYEIKRELANSKRETESKTLNKSSVNEKGSCFIPNHADIIYACATPDGTP